MFAEALSFLIAAYQIPGTGYSSAADFSCTLDVDTGLRFRALEGQGSDSVLQDMPRGSPAEICVKINPGDRVLG